MGGAEVSLINLTNYLIKQNQQVTVITAVANSQNDLSKQLNKAIDLKTLNMNLAFFKLQSVFAPGLVAKKISKIVDLSQYDSITAALELFPTYVVQKIAHPNKVYQIHSDLNQIVAKAPKIIQAKINKLNSKYPADTKYMIVGQNAIDVFKKLNPSINEQNINLTKNIIDVIDINNKAKQNTPKIKTGKKTIFSIGRLVPEKAFERIIPIAQKMKDSEFYIIGEGVQRNKIEKLISDENVKNVTLLGAQSNPYSYLKQSDCLLLTSKTEGSPTVIYEALSLKKPFVSTNVADLSFIAEQTGSISLNQEASDDEFVQAFEDVKFNPNFSIEIINDKIKSQINKIYGLEKDK
jgi:glycosyltransferase involved in cell wall biosynthesis